MQNEDKIIIKGARENNLKNIDLEIPRNKLVVFSGVSGSGKSTLAFDTIYAEGQRRYIESLSSYARMFLGQSSKPDVDRIDGLSPAIAIDQKSTNHNPRSTVGTVTEIYDYIRLLYSSIGRPYCPICHKPISSQTIDQIIPQIMSFPTNSKLLILSPLIRGEKGTHQKLFEELKKDGFVRVEVDGEVRTLDEDIKLNKNIKHTISVVIDRLVLRENIDTRLTESVETALKESNGLVLVEVVGGERNLYSTRLSCPDCGYSIGDVSPRLFSFNSPFGACEKCSGLGYTMDIDEDLIINDRNKSVAQGALNVSGWMLGAATISLMQFKAVAKQYGIDLNQPIKDMPRNHLDILLYGNGGETLTAQVDSKRYTGELSFNFEGVITNLARRFKETQSDGIRKDIARYMNENDCQDCHRKRLRPEALAFKISGLDISEMCEMSIKKLYDFFEKIKLNKYETTVSEAIIKEIKARLKFLIDVGLNYLTLSRTAETLSGGESQRIRLATQIGSGLVGVLYVLDEPSIGLHQSDNEKLLKTLLSLRDLKNTVIVVEHDEETIRTADFLVDVGPLAGVHGGEIVAAGTPAEVSQNEESITGRFLSGKDKIDIPKTRRSDDCGNIVIKGAKLNNLKNIDVSIPIKKLNVVTGVSGSGKSSLVNGVLLPYLSNRLGGPKMNEAQVKSIDYGEIDKVISIDQSPIGKSPRSNPATYTGVFTSIRELFASTKDAKERGYNLGRFSFNVAGGRCEACGGDGVKEIEMYFLPDITVPCEICHGKRYNRETLEVKYKNKNIYDVLNMTVEEALTFFENIPSIKTKIQALYDVGLGYIKLGQSSTTLSGGESQRVKLASELARKSTGKTLYILDEPTTGLHPYDVKKLINILDTLVDKGNTIVVIEHNLDIIKVADNIIDLGPNGGDEGGKVIATGTPEAVSKIKESLTGQWLKKIL